MNFTEEEKWLLKEMCKMYEKEGTISFLGAISKGIEKQGAIVIINFSIKNKLFFFFKEGHSIEETRKKMCNICSILFFFKKLYEEKLIHTVICQHAPYFEILGLSNHDHGDTDTEIQGSMNGETITIDIKKFEEKPEISGFATIIYNIDGVLYNTLLNIGYGIFDSKLLHYVEKDFKTDDEIRFDKQTKNSFLIAFFSAILGGLFTFGGDFITKMIKEDQPQQLRLSIDSIKSVKVENDTFAVNAKVDTVTVKQVTKPMTNRNKNRNVTITITEDQFQQLRQSIESTKPGEVGKPNK